MSGGRWNHTNSNLSYEMFENYNYGGRFADDQKYNCKEMGDPMQDRELSELVWDVFGIIHDADYYLSDDIDEETYRKRVAKFKRKWFGDDRTYKSERIDRGEGE